ncbi:MAG: hypothetical protein VKK62_03690 [Synechococcaceae cyanobacterium]|nr:hypothetical protein [Synechococcaceae cyanobacterium]
MTPALPSDATADSLRILDTEGSPLLRQVAVLDGRGQLLYEAQVEDPQAEYYAADLIRPLPELLRDLRERLQGCVVVAHHASHDQAILSNSFQHCGLNPPKLEWQCTLEMAQELHPDLGSYGLGSLCDALAVGEEPFRRDAAHQAAYDARFTYLLYRHLQRDQHSRRLTQASNPFSSTRVDTPFQHFADERKVHQAAFARLSAVLRSVAGDVNQQSQGAVLLGEPGAGKTHLVMRLAEEVLRRNRLLFVRQPTQAAHVLFHIYSRTLESLVEPVGEGGHSQLDLLLIRALRRIMQETGTQTERDREILAALEQEDLQRLGVEATEARRLRWERLEMRLLRWWADRHSAAGYGRQILQGLLRFCRYTRPDLRESCRRWLATGEREPVERELEGLSAWNEELQREEFSLQALRVVGLLSSLDAPLILVFDQLEGLWQDGNRELLLRFGEVIKELFTHVPHSLVLVTLFPDRWQRFRTDFDGSITDRVGQHLIVLEAPRAEQVEEILDLRLAPLGVRAVELFAAEELEQIVRMPSLRACLNRAAAVFEHRVRGVPLPAPTPPPPPTLLSPGEGGLEVVQRLLNLEQELQLLQRRIRSLERRGPGGSGDGSAAATDVEATTRQPDQGLAEEATGGAAGPGQAREQGDGAERSTGGWLTDPGGAGDSGGSPYEELFQRYRESCLRGIEQRWQDTPIVDETDDAGKLKQIVLHFRQARPLSVDRLQLGNRRVPDNVLIRMGPCQRCVAFLHTRNSTSVHSRLSNLNQLVVHHRKVQFILMRDASAPQISSKQASAALQAFRTGSGDGVIRTFVRPLDRERRIALEFTHQLINDIINRDLEIPLAEGLRLLEVHHPQNWIVRLLQPAGTPGSP